MRVRLTIKGMDRIGQDVLRTVERQEPAFFVVAMNDLAPAEAVAHLVCRGRLRHPPDVIDEAASCVRHEFALGHRGHGQGLRAA
jgi:glyceraldehyde-3-phosphate dehydrogenase/erythrose-4-phosphate dehydrogenase